MSGSKRVAIVTGASRGLGRVIAAVLAARGDSVVIGGRDVAALSRAADELSASGAAIVAVDGDVTDAAVRGRMVAAARELGGLDILVNNASELGPMGPLLQLDVTRLGRVFPVNAGAPLALMQLALPLLASARADREHHERRRDWGVPGLGRYGASKAALELRDPHVRGRGR